MRLVFIVTGLATGGAEIMLLKLLERIDRRRFEPYVFSLTTKGEIGPRIEALDVPVKVVGLRPSAPLAPLTFLKFVRELAALKPDVAQTWMYHADLIGGLAARLAGVRALAWGVRNSDLSPSASKLSTRLVMRSCALASSWLPRQILFCSEASRAMHIKAGYAAKKARLLPNGFDLERFVPDATARLAIREELGLRATAQLVGLVARYDPQKNHLGFVEAAKGIVGVLPDVHFVLPGGGVDCANEELMSVIKRSGVAQCFHLLGRREDVPRLMAALDCLVSSSSYGEAFPNVLGEAMACGTPCVTTDVGDCAFIVGDTGRVVAVGDLEGLAHGVIELLSLPDTETCDAGAKSPRTGSVPFRNRARGEAIRGIL